MNISSRRQRKLWGGLSLLAFTFLIINLVLANLNASEVPVAAASIASAGQAASNSNNQQAALQPPTPVKHTLPPFVDPHLPSLNLKIAFSSEQAVVNGTPITATVTVSNSAPDPANNLVVSLPTPAGTVALPGPGFVSATGGWQWPQAVLDGSTRDSSNQLMAGASATFTATLQLTTYRLHK